MDPHLVTFISSADAGEASYEFVADGPVVPVRVSPYSSPSGNEVRATSNFTVDADAQDEPHTVTGYTGNGYGDAYEVYGPITDVTVDNKDWMWIELDGEEVAEDGLVAQTAPAEEDGDGLSNALVIDGTVSDSSSTYSFEVSGEVRQSEELTSTPADASAWDTLASNVSNGKVLGIVRDGVDGYRYSGTVTSMQVCGDATVEFETQE